MGNVIVKISAQGVQERAVRPISAIAVKGSRSGATAVKSLENAIVVTGNDYLALIVMEANPYDVALVTVHERCGASLNLLFEGEFNWFDVSVNKDKKTLSITPREKTKRTCLESEMELDSSEIYPLDLVVVKPFNGVYEIECCEENSSTPTGQPILCVDATKWWVKENTFTDMGGGVWHHVTCWHRIKAVLPCVGGLPVAPGPSGWVMLSNDCPTNSTWVTWPVNANVIAPMKAGRFLNEALVAMLEGLSCGLTVRSNFLGINPSGATPTNQAYSFAASNLQEMTIHQKSDVKRPLDSNPATPIAWVAKPAEILKDLLSLFNMETKVIGSDLRIEHVSYFAMAGTVDVTSVAKVNEYTHDSEKSEQFETFAYMDELATPYFKGLPISYKAGSGVKAVKLAKISTDVVFIQESGASDQAITDAGFCLVATKVIGGVRSMIDYNRPLSWTELHDNLFRWGRRLPAGDLNGSPVNFYSWILRRKMAPYVVPYCCGAEWSPETDMVIDANGTGEISEWSYSPEKGSIKITTKF